MNIPKILVKDHGLFLHNIFRLFFVQLNLKQFFRNNLFLLSLYFLLQELLSNYAIILRGLKITAKRITICGNGTLQSDLFDFRQSTITIF